MSGPDAMRNLTCDEVRELAGAFVLGSLEAGEAAAVRSHLAAHPDGHPEIPEVGAVIPALFEVVPIVEPPASLKGRIMAAAAADLAARGGPAATTSAEASSAAPVTPAASAAPTVPQAAPVAPTVPQAAPVAPTAPHAAPVAPPARTAPPAVPQAAPITFPSAEERETRGSRTSPGSWLLRIAAVLAIALLGGWNLLLQSQLGGAQAYERNVAAVLDAAAEPGSLTAVLAAGGGTGSGIAAVQEDGDLSIAMRDLAPTTGSSVYEAWVIGADGVPVPVGNFRVGENGIGFLEAGGLPSAEGIVLALTLEPGPGANTPTMPIISSGIAGLPG